VVQAGASGFAPPDKLELSAVVFDVALAAFRVFPPGVEPFSLRDLSSQRLMTFEASIGRHPVLGVVALHAVQAALEVRVRSAQFARRNLTQRGETATCEQCHHHLDGGS
jgi:hypothetical protein